MVDSRSPLAFILVLVAAVFGGACSSSSAFVEKLDVNGEGGLVGEWYGVALGSPQPMHVELVLSAPGADSEATPSDRRRRGAAPVATGSGTILEGTVRLQPLTDFLDDRDFDSRGQAVGSRVALIFDDASQTFTITAPGGGRSRDRRLNAAVLGRQGVFDSPGQRLALIAGGRAQGLASAVSFVRPKEYKSMAKAYKRFNKRGSTGGGGLASLFSSAPSKKKLKKWIQPALESLPSGALANGSSGSVERLAIPLFEDEHFEDTFGETFDELGSGKLNAIWRRLGKNVSRNPSVEDRSIYALHRMFWTHVGSPTGVETLQGVHALRGVMGWRKHQAKRLASMDGSSGQWEAAQSIASKVESLTASWTWRSDTEALTAEANRTLQGMAYPALAKELDTLEGLTNGRNKLLRLAEFRSAHPGKRRYLESSQQRELDARTDELISTVVETEIAPSIEALSGLGSGLTAIKNGNEWLRRLQSDFGAVARTSAYQRALAGFEARREGDLAAAQAEMLELIRRSGSQEVGRLTGTWFQGPKDRRHPTFAAARQAVESRKQELDASYEKRIKDAEGAARLASTKDPRRPLQYIDFRRFPSGEFLEFIYYGTGKDRTQAEFLKSLTSRDVGKLFDLAKYTSKMKLAYANYHDLYYKRYGKTPATRRASGESWTGIVNVTIEKDRWGNVTNKDVDTVPFVYVRDRYADAYQKTLVNELDAGLLIFGALMGAAEQGGSDREIRSRFEQNLFSAILLSPFEYQTAYDSFLNEFKKDYPATVQHFEENLRRAFQLEVLRQIRAPRVDR